MIKLLRYLKKYWYFAILAPLFMIVEVGMDMLLTMYMSKMINFGVQTGNMDKIISYGLMMLLIVFVGVIGGILSGVFTNLAGFNFSNDLRKDVFKKIMSFSESQTDYFQTGSLVTRVTNDITQIQNMISMCLRGLVRALSFFVMGIFFTLKISSQFGVVLLVILPIEVILLLIFIKLVFPIFKVIQSKLDKVNTVVLENTSGARVVKAFSKEEYEYNRFKIANDDYTKTNLYVSKISSLINPLLTLIVNVGQIVLYYIGGKKIIEFYNRFTGVETPTILIGDITAAISYISMICMSIIMLGMMFTNLAKAFASADRINEILDTKPDQEFGDLALDELHCHGVVEFKNVSFKYPSGKRNVLENLNFKINQGETIAIVGATGSGKSTLVNLLARFYDTSSGEIYIDEHEISEFKKRDLHNIVGICLQKAEMFNMTIAENISLGKPNSTSEEIVEAANIAQANEFIDAKELGYDEIVSEGGNSLSGGQKQRINIARAVIKKPEILIFDDSTSALDLITEAKLYKSLKEKLGDVTKIVVAQRIATARNADKIMVLDDGKINDFGTHNELIERCPIYKDIYESQLKKEVM